MSEITTVDDAHAWLGGLRAADREVVLKFADALRALIENKQYGSVGVTVVAGRATQLNYNQTYKPGK